MPQLQLDVTPSNLQSDPVRESVHRFRSNHTQNERTIWVREPAALDKTCDLIVFLDGEFYRDGVGAISTLETLQNEPGWPDALTVFVSSHSEEARSRECPCHPSFSDFIALELLPWLELQYPSVSFAPQRVLIGLSYTGLAATYIALRAPGCFTKVIAQSGSFWSNDCWLVGEYAKLPHRLPTDFYLDVGTKETREEVRHENGAVQELSQIEGVQRMRNTLLTTGHQVRYREFEGGHDFVAWKKTLPDALRWALLP